MKIAIAAQGGSLDAMVDQRFGRAVCFVVLDPDTMEFEVVDNKQNFQAAAGAGIQAAQIVADQGAKAVLTGNCGPKAFAALQAGGVEVVVGVKGRIEEAVRDYLDGKYRSAAEPNVEGHWM